MHEKHVIDLWEDGVNVTLHKLCANNGIDVTELLAYDMPSDGSIGRVAEGTGDMHVEFSDLEAEDEAGWSAFSGIAPETRAAEPEPADTDPPFDQNAAIFNVPGLFGSCLKAYGEAFACVAVHGYSTDDLRNAFKAVWGIEEEDMLTIDKMMPVARSTGDAFWGGWNRNLNPANFSMPATQAAVRVKFHNVTRTSYGPHALVDWPRIKAMASMIGCRVLADDRYARGHVNRIDFAIDPREVVSAPTNFKMPRFKVDSKGPNSVIKKYYIDHAIAFLNASCYKEAGRTRYTAGDTVTTESAFEIHRFTIYTLIADESSSGVNFPLVLRDATKDGTEDLWVRSKGQDMKALLKRNQYVDVEQVMKAIALGNLSRGIGVAHRGFTIRGLISDVKDGTSAEQTVALKELQRMVRQVWNPNVLEAVTGYGNVIEPGHGGKLVGQIISRAGEKHGIMQEHNLQRLWAKMIDTPNIVAFLSEIAARAISAVDRIVAPVFLDRYLDMLASSGDFELVLNNMFAARKRYWVNRYYRTAKSLRKKDNARSVTSQLMSKIFRHLTFRVMNDGTIITNTLASINALNGSVVAFIRKRNRKYKREELNYHLEDYLSNGVDLHVAANVATKFRDAVKWKDVAAKFVTAHNEFQEDIRNFVWRVTHMSAASAVVIDEDDPTLYDEQAAVDSDTEDESGASSDSDVVLDKGKIKDEDHIFSTTYTHTPEPSIVPATPVAHTQVYEPDWDFGTNDDIVDHTAGCVRLVDELAEDMPGTPVDFLLEMAEEYGDIIHINEYNEIFPTIRSRLLQRNQVHATGMDVDNLG